MSQTEPTLDELSAWLDESLPGDDMARIESLLRSRPELTARLVEIHRRRDNGLHSLGEIWRRGRLTCPDRGQLSKLLLGVLPQDEADYIRFHIQEVGCRRCAASFADLQTQQGAAADTTQRRKRFFASSAGLLKRDEA